MTRRRRKRVKMGIMMPLRMGAAPRVLKTPRTLKSLSLSQKNLKSRKRMTVLLPNEIIEVTKMSPLNPKMIGDLGGQALERKEDLVKGDRDQDLGDEVAEGRDRETRTGDMVGVGAEIEAEIEEEKEAGKGWKGRENVRGGSASGDVAKRGIEKKDAGKRGTEKRGGEEIVRDAGKRGTEKR